MYYVYVPPNGAFGAYAAGAYAARRREEERQRREEESLTRYSEADLEQDWQFKIVHGDFSTLEKVQAVMQEQAAWGWIFVEKFYGRRIRFKRPRSEEARDAERSGNPYSTKSEAAGAGCASLFVLALVVTGFVCWVVGTLT